MKQFIVLITIAILTGFAMPHFSPAYSETKAAPSSDDMLVHIKVEEFGTPTRPAARFYHDFHTDTVGLDDCSVCHHVYKDGKLVEGESSEDQSCSSCHTVKPTTENPVGLMNAFHQNCIGCHTEKGAGPLACGECHVK